MFVRFNFLIHTHNFAFFVNDICRSENAVVFPAHHLFERPDAISFAHRVVSIRQQNKRQRVLLLKGFVRFNAVRADAQDLQPVRAENSIIIPEIAGFCCAAGGVVFRVKV